MPSITSRGNFFQSKTDFSSPQPQGRSSNGRMSTLLNTQYMVKSMNDDIFYDEQQDFPTI